jgi:hypothetical protein
MLRHMIPMMTRTRIQTRASKASGTSSSTRYVFLVGTTLRTCSTGMSAGFLCVFSLHSFSLMLVFLFQWLVKGRTFTLLLNITNRLPPEYPDAPYAATTTFTRSRPSVKHDSRLLHSYLPFQFLSLVKPFLSSLFFHS